MLEEREKNWIKSRFRRYYVKHELKPDAVEQREFGYGNWEKKIEARHLSFENSEKLNEFLREHAPLYVSRSTAYYERPAAQPMNNKGWRGSDLVFDLDAEMEIFDRGIFEKVRSDAIRLIEEFLIPEFGVDKNKIALVFSGNRGFHVHVFDERFRMLGREARREIASYLAGVGLDYKKFFDVDKKSKKILGPTPKEAGYRGRFARMVIETLETEPEKISRVFNEAEERNRFVEGIKQGVWSRTRLPKVIERLEGVAKELPVKSINVDVGVTQDTSKLIRLPGSLHGSTGFVVLPVKKYDMEIENAIAFGEERVKIKVNENVEVKIGEGMKAEKGSVVDAPEYLALYLLLKNKANLL
ncbi:MAG: DNA primase catalytic subunit PriS [Candidatus Anstonellales archaeon]